MKKIATFLFVAMTSIALVSCGEEEKKDDKKEDKKETKKDNMEDEGDDEVSGNDVATANWTQLAKDEFLNSCIEKAGEDPNVNGEEYCNCMLDKMIEKYPNPADVAQLDMEWMQKEAMKCLGQ